MDKGLSANAREVRVLKEIPYIRMPKVPPRSMDFLTDDEYARLCSAASSESDRLAMLLVAGDAGLRKGEILALEWGDLDLGAGAIVVARNVWHDNSSDEHVGSPKGGRLRKVPMTQRLRQALLAHRHLRGRRVFCTLTAPAHLGQLEIALRVLCTRARMRQIGWHVLRHTFGSHLAQRGASPKAIQELMGHADIATTTRYMHLAPAHHREAIALLEPT